MRKPLTSIALLLAFAALPAMPASAQVDARPGEDAVSFSLIGGGFFSADELGPATEFDQAATAGGAVTFWANEYVGVRANVLWSNPGVLAASESPLAGEDPDIWAYTGDIVARLPLEGTAQVSWFPFISAGLGGKTYNFATLGTETDFTGSFGAGVELRFGQDARWGIKTEVRDFVSNFDRFGFDQMQNDVMWTGGLTFNF